MGETKITGTSDQPAEKSGWHSTMNSRVNHFYRDGRSLCGRYMILCEPSNRTFHENDCKGCQTKLSLAKAEVPHG